jgi:hypothetical protein
MWRRNPVLMAMVVSSLILGMTALAAAIAVWQASSSCSIPRKTLYPYLVQVVAEMTGRAEDVQIEQQAPRAA